MAGANHMFKPVSALIVASMVLAGCATVRDSRVNPFNWFGKSRSQAVNTSTETGQTNPLIPERAAISFFNKQPESYGGQPVETITQLLIERRPGGAIVRVTGVADRNGPFDVRLIKDETAPGDQTLSYTLRAIQQPGARSSGPRARTVTAADWLTDQELFGVSTIRVAGRTNAQASRR